MKGAEKPLAELVQELPPELQSRVRSNRAGQETRGDDDFYGTSYLVNARGEIAAEVRCSSCP